MPRPLSFHQIEAFRAVVVSGTTVAAARMLHTTQPSISRLIAQAQSASGLKLFVNDRGRLQLTREGRHLFETVQQHFQGFERIEQTISALRESGAGVFRIACTPSLAQSILPPAMQRFAKAYSSVHYNVATLGSREIGEGLRQGMYDIALTNTRFDGSEFGVHELEETQAVCISALDHPFSELDEVSIEDLANQVFISLPAHDELTRRLQDTVTAKSLVLPSSVETIYSSTICTFAAQGLGVGVVNPYMASVFKDRLCIRRFVPKLPVLTYAAFARYAPASELAEYFFSALKDTIRLGDWSPSPRPTKPSSGPRPRGGF